MKKKVYIISHKRTPVGGFGGALSSLSAVDMGVLASKASLEIIPIDLYKHFGEVYFGNVLSANLGQAPARQIALGAGLPYHSGATTVNKVCSSGIKAVSLAATSIILGKSKMSLSGGAESMSNAPYYLISSRFGNKLGHQVQVDGLLKDGLWDVYNDFHMGNAAEITNRELGISREMQDEYAIRSYKLAQKAIESRYITNEIVPIEIKNNKGTIEVVSNDEDLFKVNYDKIPLLKPTFEKKGTITPANASNINDGAAALVVAEETFVKTNALEPVAEILDFTDAAQQPEYFATSPALAIRKILKNNQLSIDDIDYFEINEAYASVAIANSQILNIPIEKINIFGGAVAIGHPLGMSGARIIGRLINVLKHKKAEFGIAAICNGGGGSSAMLIRKL